MTDRHINERLIDAAITHVLALEPAPADIDKASAIRARIAEVGGYNDVYFVTLDGRGDAGGFHYSGFVTIDTDIRTAVARGTITKAAAVDPFAGVNL